MRSLSSLFALLGYFPLRAVVSAAAAGGVVVGVDAAVLFGRGGLVLDFRATPFTFLAVALVLVVVVLLASLLARADGVVRARAKLVGLAAGLCSSAGLFRVLARTLDAGDALVVQAVVVVAVVVITAAATWLATIARASSLLVGALLGAASFAWVDGALLLGDRAIHNASHLYAVVGVALASCACALAACSALESLREAGALSLPRSLFLVVAVALVGAAPLVEVEYAAAQQLVAVAAVLFAFAGASQWLRAPHVVPLAAGLVATVAVFWLWRTTGPGGALRCGSDAKPTLDRMLAEAARPASGTSTTLASLRARPEAREAAALDEAAMRWNSSFAAEERVDSVVLITVDTLRADHAGYLGTDEKRAPQLARLARSSVRFTHAYAQGGWTSMSLPSLMWSRHPSFIDFIRLYELHDYTLHTLEELPENAVVRVVFQSPRREPTPSLAELLSARGLVTAAIVNDGYTSFFDEDLAFTRGFDYVENPSLPLDAYEGPRVRAAAKELGKNVTPRAAAAVLEDKDTVAAALRWLDEHEGQRFFLWVHLFGPHSPYLGGDSSKGYVRDVRVADEGIGRLVDRVDALAGSVAVVVASDHGESFRERGSKYHGRDVYEESIRVPLLVRSPTLPPATVDQPVGIVDVAPTILHLVGEEPSHHHQGFSLLPVVARGARRPPVFAETWRYQPGRDSPSIHRLAVVDGEHKVMYDRVHDVFSAYDLSADPGELTARCEPAIVEPGAAWLVGAFGF